MIKNNQIMGKDYDSWRIRKVVFVWEHPSGVTPDLEDQIMYSIGNRGPHNEHKKLSTCNLETFHGRGENQVSDSSLNRRQNKREG